MEHECKHDDIVLEMHADVRELLTQFKNMNGKLMETKTNVDKHNEDSYSFRRKVDILWAVVHSAKWVIILIFGSGALWKFLGMK